MLNRIHERLGTAGFVISILALLVALTGGAYAASGALTGKQKKEVEKIAKKYAGKPGAAGATGPGGAQGPAGAKGDAGAAGSNGTNGTTGREGPEGPEGPEGSPWTAGGVVPTGQTEIGSWALPPFVSGQTEGFATISFPFPVSQEAYPVEYVSAEESEEGTGPAVCPGTPVAPKAAAGTVCVYESGGFNAVFLQAINPGTNESGVEAGKTGVILKFTGTATGASRRGTWAVTAK